MCAETPDYKDTLNLPQTDFPMRAGLPKREPNGLPVGNVWASMTAYVKKRGVRHLPCMTALLMRMGTCTSDMR